MNQLLNLIKTLFNNSQPEPILGVLDSTERPDNLYNFDEIVKSPKAPAWKNKTDADIKKLPYLYQGSSSSCVAHTLALMSTMLFINQYTDTLKFSPAWFYRSRANKLIGDGQGMRFNDIVKIGSTIGGMPYDLMPSDNLTDQQIDAIKDKWFHKKISGIFTLPENWVNLPMDFDTIASTSQVTNKGIMLWFSFGPGEYFNREIPVMTNLDLPYRHSVTLIDTGVFKGVPYLVVQCSADKKFPIKKISREFFRRCYLASYPMNFVYELGGSKPSYDFTIIGLQKCLRHEGLFPQNISFVESMGPITKKGITQFQEKYKLPVSGTVDKYTRDKLIELFP